MAAITDVAAGTYVNLTLVTTIITSAYNNVKVVASQINYEAAKLLASNDIDATHANIYSELPAGTPNNPQEYNYVIVERSDGVKYALGVPWISENFAVVKSTLINITVREVTTGDVETIRNALVALGYGDLTLSLKTVE